MEWGEVMKKEVSNKANEDMLNALHDMVAIKLAKMLKEAEGEPELMLKVLREARGFLKDNFVTADIQTSNTLKQVESKTVEVSALPFKIAEAKES